MTRKQAAQLAKRCAIEHALKLDPKNRPRYLQQAIDSKAWQPHEWVVDAIMEAANQKPTAEQLDRAELVLEGNHPWIYFENVVERFGLATSFIYAADTLVWYVEQYLTENA